MGSKKLQLSLKKQWFEMTKSGIKTEDYREITPYWAKRLLLYQDDKLTAELDDLSIDQIVEDIKEAENCLGEIDEEINFVIDDWYLSFNQFAQNTMTLGYPSKDDKSRIINLEHKGIEIREGNPEWGAEKGKLYFVIKHGKIITL